MDVRDAVFQTWSALFSSGQVAELRVLGINHTESFNAGGWFDNPAVFADVAARYDAKNPIGIYVTINPLYPACLARSGNAVVERTRTLTADRDVSSRQWLPIDIDPIRPSGVSSSNNEQAITLNSAYKIIAWLTTECQFPEPLLANSGNGTHILYRVSLDNTDDAKATIAGCLAALAARFDTPISQIDTTVSNAARIWRCYGTHARKGTNTDDRPHRQSSVISASRLFADFVPVPTPMLLQLASRVKKKRKQRANRRTVAADVDLDAFIAKHGIQVKRQQAWDGGTKHILEACIFDPSHTRTSACLGKNRAGVVFYKCQHSACDGRGWKDVRSHFEGAKTPAGVVTRRRDRDASDSGKPDPFELARAFIQEACTDHDSNQVIVRRWRCSIYLWDLKTHAYRILDDDTLRVMLLRFLEDAVEAVTTRLAADVRACFEALITLDTRAEIPFEATIDPGTMQTTTRHARHNWHILSNGIVDIDEITGDTPLADCLMPHAPTWFSTTALPFSFPTRPNEFSCPRWLDFLAEVFEDDLDRINLIQEAFAYCFDQTLRLETFFVLHGAGRNGKSTILDVLTMLLGADNISSLSPQQLGSRFMLSQLNHKAANICADLREIDRIEEGTLKAVVSGDLVYADQKYREGVNFRPRTRLWFSTNVLPRLADTSIGIWRRMQLIPFDYIVPVESVDIHLIDTLRKELPAVFLWTIKGLIRLRANKGFTRSECCTNAKHRYRLTCFPVMTFIEECCTADPLPTGQPAQATVAVLWGAYRAWCHASGLTKPKPLHTFSNDLLAFTPRIQYVAARRTSRAATVLHGIRLRTDYHPDPGQAVTPAQYGLAY